MLTMKKEPASSSDILEPIYQIILFRISESRDLNTACYDIPTFHLMGFIRTTVLQRQFL